jgi:hypothetical protein
MPSSAELRIALGLRSILSHLDEGAAIEDSVRFRDVQAAFEYFVPATLAEPHPEWRNESLDGFYFHLARKTADLEAEFFGSCILISDQSLTPIHLRLQISDRINEVSWLECRLGEAGPHGMIRTNWSTKKVTAMRLRLQDLTPGDIEWVYQITFGQRRP